jgi:hypothetical protein
MSEMILNGLHEAFDNLSRLVSELFPRVVVMLTIILVGWIVALVLRKMLRSLMNWAKLDRFSERSGASHLLRKAALPSLSELLCHSLFWLVWIGFIVAGVSALGMTSLQNQISRFLLFLPQVFVALLILLFGTLAANFLARAALLGAVNAGYPSPRILSGAVRMIIVALAISMALEQVGLGTHTMLVAFAIMFGALMFGLALAFGLGGQDLAKQALEKHFAAKDKGDGDEPSPL